jgi:hypothetical protein
MVMLSHRAKAEMQRAQRGMTSLTSHAAAHDETRAKRFKGHSLQFASKAVTCDCKASERLPLDSGCHVVEEGKGQELDGKLHAVGAAKDVFLAACTHARCLVRRETEIGG